MIALARAISLLEDGRPNGESVLAELFPRTGSATVIFTATDDCNNSSSCIQVFVIIDSLSGNTLGRLLTRFRNTDFGAQVIREDRQLLDTLGAAVL